MRLLTAALLTAVLPALGPPRPPASPNRPTSATSPTGPTSHGAIFPAPPREPYGGPGDTTATPATPVPVPGGPAPAPGAAPPPPAPTSGAPVPGPQPNAPSPLTPGPDESVDLTAWTWWWELNKEPFLQIGTHLWGGTVTTGSDGFYLGQGYRQQRREESLRPSEALVRQRVLPGLLEALGARPSNDVVSSCLVALARIGEDLPEENRLELQHVLRPYLADSSQELAETATIALGILGDDASALLLGEVLLDTRTGREAVGRSEVPLRTRAFAAYGLGLLGSQLESEDLRRFVVHRLARALATDETATPDLGAACVLALGKVPLAWTGIVPEARSKGELPASASREAQVLHLLDLLDERGLHRLVQAHVPTALGFLLEPEPGAPGETLRQRVVGELLERLGGRRRGVGKELRQSIVLALGRLGDRDDDPLDVRVREALLDSDVGSGDVQTARFALIAAAQVAGRPGSGPAASSSGVAEVRQHLLRQLARGQSDERSWAALALSLLERQRAAEGHVSDGASLDALRAMLAESVSPLEVGALSIACGLARDPGAGEPLLAKLGTVRQEQTRGHVAIGLGLLPAREALEPIRRLVEDATYKPLLLRESAIALGLLGDRRVTELLGERLARASSLAAQASIAQALGRIGDASSVEPLLALLADESLTAGARAFAAVALGYVADQDTLPWNTVLSVDVNYAAAPATLFDHAGFGVLNLL